MTTQTGVVECDECTTPADPWDPDNRARRPKPEHSVCQIDGWPNTPPGEDVIISGDSDGDALTASPDTTYRSKCMGSPGIAVRVLVLDGTDPATAARLLRKMADWVAELHYSLAPPPASPAEHGR